jgi:hypothetical protein
MSLNLSFMEPSDRERTAGHPCDWAELNFPGFYIAEPALANSPAFPAQPPTHATPATMQDLCLRTFPEEPRGSGSFRHGSEFILHELLVALQALRQVSIGLHQQPSAFRAGSRQRSLPRGEVASGVVGAGKKRATLAGSPFD